APASGGASPTSPSAGPADRPAYPARSTGAHSPRPTWSRPPMTYRAGMSTSPPPGPGRAHWPRPGTWPVWVVPALVAFVQVVGSLGAQRDRTGANGSSGGPPWEHGGGGPGGMGHTDLDVLGFALLLGGPALL